MKDEEIVGDLVVSRLSVTLRTIEKTFKIYDGLWREGLTDMDALVEMKPQEVFERPERAGYPRGDFMIGLLGERLLHLANALCGNGTEALRELVEPDGLPEVRTSFQPSVNRAWPAVEIW